MENSSERAWKRRVDSLEFALQQGRQQEVCDALQGMGLNNVPIPVRARLANLAWRTEMPWVGATVLHPVVRKQPRPEASQVAEYAACLVRLGAVDEARVLAEGVSPPKYPRVLMYLAFAHASQWNYEAAALCLTQYLKLNQDPTLRLVALLNLAAALLHVRELGPATTVLEEILLIAPRSQHLIRTSASHLYAAVLILQGEVDEADDFLSHAQKQLSTRVSGQDFLIRKWRAVAGVQDRPDVFSLDRLDHIRREARASKQYETVRYCDRVRAVALGDRELFLHLYFGTPYPIFRESLLREFGPVEIPEVYLWQEGDDPPLDAFGLWGEEPLLHPAKLAFSTLAALCEDFYGSRSPASLYGSLFPHAFYEPTSSDKKVREGVRRLRMDLMDTDTDVVEYGGRYRLLLRGESLIVPLPKEDRPPVPLAILGFLQDWGNAPFRTEDVQQYLGSRTGASRLLQEAEALGGVRPVKGKRNVYQMAAPVGAASRQLKSVP